MKKIKRKSISGVKWNLLEKYGVQFVKLVLGIILARLLSPADYGLIGIIIVFFSLASVFINSGLKLAFIQKIDANDEDASTIFFFNFLVSLLAYLIFWFIAPIIANFYDQDKLIDLIRVMAVILIVNSISIIQVAKLTKEINFKPKSIISIISVTISGIIGITAAFNGYKVWSLVFQIVAASTINSFSLWLIYKWRPKFIFSINSLKNMFSFSIWILLTNIMKTIFDNVYILIIGKVYPMQDLGYYTKAKQFQEISSKQPTLAVSNVAFPIFSKLQNDKIAFKNTMHKYLFNILLFLTPILSALFVVSKPLFLLLLTEKWLPIVPFFKLFLVIGLIFPLQQINVKALSALGYAKLNFRISLFGNLLRIFNILLLYKYGILEIIIGEVFISILILFFYFYFTKMIIKYGIMEQLKDFGLILLLGIVTSSLGYLFLEQIDHPIIKIVLGILTTLVFYFGSLFFFKKEFIIKGWDSIKMLIK